MKSVSAADFAGGQPLTSAAPAPVATPTKTPSLLDKAITGAGNIFKKGAASVTTDISKGANALGDVTAPQDTSLGGEVKKAGALIQTGVSTAGDVAGTAGALLAAPINAGVSKASDALSNLAAVQKLAREPVVSSFLDSINKGIMSGEQAWEILSKNHPDVAKNISNLANIGTLITGEKPAQAGLDAAAQATKDAAIASKNAVGGAVDATATGLAKTADVAKATAKVGGDLAKGTGNTVKLVAGGAARIPGRIATNVEEKVAQSAAIKELPTKIAQDAAHDGVDTNDIKELYNIPTAQKAPVRQLADYVKQYADGNKTTHPMEIVGRPIAQRIKALNVEKGRIGQQLGDVASTQLGNLSTKEIAPTVFNRLKAVPGLSGLTLGKTGLDFGDTVLQTSATKSDRAAIQNIFNDATRAGTGKQKHLLRQELFEVLDGKKKSLANLTGTQEKAYQAVRSGLADVLDGKSDTYKALNQQYAKIARPLGDLQKFMKTSAGTDEDIVNMKAGLLARRLTSNAASGPELKGVLRKLDAATAVKGKTQLSVEKLQDAYNIFARYYPEIVNKTSLQGEVRSGIEGASGVRDAIGKVIGGAIGKTDAVRRKAFEKALEEALR